jgi:hypothetical protein
MGGAALCGRPALPLVLDRSNSYQIHKWMAQTSGAETKLELGAFALIEWQPRLSPIKSRTRLIYLGGAS